MLKILLGAIISILTIIVLSFALATILPISKHAGFSEYRTDFAGGLCTTVYNTCSHIGEGCGGGHGSCSNLPEIPFGGISTCDVNFDFPSMQGYSCTCLPSVGVIGKCGWAK